MFGHPRRVLVLLHDTVMAFVSISLAFFLRLGEQVFVDVYYILFIALVFSGISLLVYLYTGLYRHTWLYVSFSDGIKVVKTVLYIVLFFVPLLFLFTRLQDIPRSVPVISWFILVVLLSASRLVYRFYNDKKLPFYNHKNEENIPVILVGFGKVGERFLRSTQVDSDNKYRVMGILSDTDERVGQLIHGIEVIGHINQAELIIEDFNVSGNKLDRMIIGLDRVDPRQIKKLLEVSHKTGCSLAKLPPPMDVQIYGDEQFLPHPIDLGDLLGRKQLSLDKLAMTQLIKGKRVLITGAGGSIGSELSRQIAKSSPMHLSLLDHGEFNLYKIDNEIKEQNQLSSINSLIADVRDRARIENIFKAERPDIVFHAAALKHVPLVETNPIEGIHTNSLGTKIIADACLLFKVQEMVLISTDKAVNPINIMGAAKRAAEIYCQAADISQNVTRFITVRFGNVLGSAGSVIPLFQEQLSKGGPLTVTHPDVERFFMTVSEAVELVIQAAALGPQEQTKGSIYVLDMGTPIKIIDLARQLISLIGKTPDQDIKIKIIGLRPGEKITEELFYGEEPPVITNMEGIFVARTKSFDLKDIKESMNSLLDSCNQQNKNDALKVLNKIVPELSVNNIMENTSTREDTSPFLKVIK